MAGARFEIEKFTGENDFVLRKIKMKTILMQQGVWGIMKNGEATSSDEKLTEKELAKKEEIEYKAYNSLLFYLNDRVLKEVQKEDTAFGVWSKLESVYITKSLSNRIHLKKKLLTFRILEGRGIMEQIQEFRKCVDDLEGIDEVIKMKIRH